MRLPKIADRARDKAGDRSAGTRTRPAQNTHAADLARQQEHTPGLNTDGADLRLDIRITTTAKTQAARPAAKAERKVERAHRVSLRRTQFEDRRAHDLAQPRVRARMAKVTAFEQAEAKLGHLRAWTPTIGVLLLAGAMLINDPLMVVLSIRYSLDVKNSVALWTISDPANLAALAAGMAISAILLVSAITAGKGLGLILFRQPLLAEDEFDEAREANKVMPTRKAGIKVGLALVVMLAAMFALHAFAGGRFNGTFQSGLVGAVLTWLVTLLPIAVVALETLASSPQTEHLRNVSKWALRFRIAEALDLRASKRKIRRQHRAYRGARKAVVNMTDVIDDVALRGAEEAAESVLAGLTTREALEKTVGDGGAPELNLTGRPLIGHVIGNPVPSNRIRNVLSRYAALNEIDDSDRLSEIWSALRAGTERVEAEQAAEGVTDSAIDSDSEDSKPELNADSAEATLAAA